MKTTSSKSTKLKCGCDSKDTESFCESCCPEAYECLKEPHIREKLKAMKPTKFQIGDNVWVLGNRKVEQKTIHGVCLCRELVGNEYIAIPRYELELSTRYSSDAHFFYTDDLLFTTRQALLDSLCS